MSGWSSPVSSPMKRPRLSQNPSSSHQSLTSSQSDLSTGTAARNLLSGALNEAIRCRDVKEEVVPETNGANKTNGSPTKNIVKGIRRKQRKELVENSNFHHTFVMKLFYRSVDLAQFKPTTSLYPVARAWMRNEPSNTNQCPVERPETPPPSSPTEDSEDVYSLPAPEEAPDPTRCPRVPPPRPPPVLEGVDLELEISDSTPPAILLSNHMVRWWEVRKSWRQSSLENEKRYEKSLKILKDMFDK